MIKTSLIRYKIIFMVVISNFIWTSCSDNQFRDSSKKTNQDKTGGTELLPSPSSTIPIAANSQNDSTPTAPVDCLKAQAIDPNAVWRTPVSSYVTGDMNRKKMNPADRQPLREFANKRCNKGFSNPAVEWQNPAIGADKPSRDLVCRLSGYAAASDNQNFGYYHYASPGDNYIAWWNPVESRLEQVYNANKGPSQGKLLVWTECVGKLSEQCTGDSIVFNCF
jgi:hypothetical protein